MKNVLVRSKTRSLALGISALFVAIGLGLLSNGPGPSAQACPDAIWKRLKPLMPPNYETVAPQPKPEPSLRKITKEGYTLHYFVVPANSPYWVKPHGENETASTIEGWHSTLPNSLFIINGGYFDPANKETISWIQTEGAEQLDPTTNQRLTGNSSLTPWLADIFNRSEFRTLVCEGGIRYSIAAHYAPAETGCTITGRLGAGPRLLPELTAEKEAFWAKDESGSVTRDPIGIRRANARSAIGLTSSGNVIVAMAEQSDTKGGVSLPDFADALKSLGAVEALNLDGGSSSSFWHEKTGAVYGKKGANNAQVKRPVLSVLSVEPIGK